MAKLLTLLLHVSLVLALVASSNADSLHPHRRDHHDLGRLIKKRASQGFGIFDSNPNTQSSSTVVVQPTSSAVETTHASSASISSASSVASSVSTTTTTTSNGGGLLGTLLSNLLPTPTTSSTSSASSASSTSSLAHTSSTPIPQTTAQLSTTSQPPSIVYLTSTGTPTPTQTSTTSASTGMSHAAMTVLIVIAASVGAAVIVWTIIRKWKFRPSSDFEGRMQPIDWQPGGSGDTGLPGQHRPLSRASSFHSASGRPDDQMRGQAATHGTTLPPLNPIPDHDFTAGPAHLAPVGGYADLARGLSPQPMMQESSGRAPSINRPAQYDQYVVPLHHGYGGY